MSIAENITDVNNKIEAACKKAGRDAKEVRLIAVSKTKPVNELQEAYNAGCRNFGENKVQEIMDKYPVLPEDIRWHMIGHLQTNKIKYIIDKVYMIHSVDSLHLAEAISKEAVKKNVQIKILLEINIADESTKFGMKADEVIDFYNSVTQLPGITVCGLMTVAPYTVDSESNRQYFVDLKQLLVDIINKNKDNINICELSMGMTGDYEIAIEEGATMVRVGTGIFGARNYNI